jgi:hypothetical protein
MVREGKLSSLKVASRITGAAATNLREESPLATVAGRATSLENSRRVVEITGDVRSYSTARKKWIQQHGH